MDAIRPNLKFENMMYVVNNAPSPEVVHDNTFVDKIKSFCLSKPGVSMIASLVFLIALVTLQPNYVLKYKVSEDGREIQTINYTALVVIAGMGGLVVFFVPNFFEQSCATSE